MTLDELVAAYSLGSWAESERLEWKESTRNLKEIVRTVASFANATGGVVVCGVNDAGQIVGQEVSDATLNAVTQSILAHTEERLTASVQRAVIEGKQVVLIAVEESPLKPHLAQGRAFRRMGSANVALSQGEYRALLAAKQNGAGADRDLVPELELADLDLEALYRFIALANERRSSNFSTLADPIDALTTLELAHNGVLTKGAALLFAHSPQRVVPQAELRLGLFDDTRDVFLDQDVLAGTLFQQLDGAIAFVKRHTLEGVDTTKIGHRTVPEFPLVAVQEMVANALVHRDYHDGASSYLSLMRGRSIEVTNPGAFPEPRVTAETMLLPHASIPRNRRLARAFYLAGLIEQWGQGGRRIADACRACSLQAPVWTSVRGTISVTISR
ncbi:MAG: putative DNA binding domain-containing protein [Proteobacteria bacterium]|nr:putative DNA binding domain-containing protein [Pseudomonadota bacterium]